MSLGLPGLLLEKRQHDWVRRGGLRQRELVPVAGDDLESGPGDRVLHLGRIGEEHEVVLAVDQQY